MAGRGYVAGMFVTGLVNPRTRDIEAGLRDPDGNLVGIVAKVT